jgi:hypothetical protein
MGQVCSHYFESYDSERLDRSSVVVYYSCLVCGKEREDVIVDTVQDDEEE